MLKTFRAGQAWIVTHTDHSLLAGYLGGHWGNASFRPPGKHNSNSSLSRLHAEAVFAIAQHDNGWWEWEADPSLSSQDQLPMGHIEVLRDHEAGVERWRRALQRFPQAPYANLLISLHAYWLTAGRTLPEIEPGFRHPLFWRAAQPAAASPEDQKSPALLFLDEMDGLARTFTDALRKDAERREWIRPEFVSQYVRMLQLCDGLSLSLCSDLMPVARASAAGFGMDSFELRDVPRSDWNDRVSISVVARGDGNVELDPYPFDIDPLPVSIPTKIVDPEAVRSLQFQAWWHAAQTRRIDVRYVSPAR